MLPHAEPTNATGTTAICRRQLTQCGATLANTPTPRTPSPPSAFLPRIPSTLFSCHKSGADGVTHGHTISLTYKVTDICQIALLSSHDESPYHTTCHLSSRLAAIPGRRRYLLLPFPPSRCPSFLPVPQSRQHYSSLKETTHHSRTEFISRGTINIATEGPRPRLTAGNQCADITPAPNMVLLLLSMKVVMRG